MVAAAVVRKTGLGKNDRKKVVMRRYDDGLDPFYMNISTFLFFVFFSFHSSYSSAFGYIQHKHQQHQLPTKKHNPSTTSPKHPNHHKCTIHIRTLLRPRIIKQERERG